MSETTDQKITSAPIITETATGFTKQQFLSAKQFAGRQDLINALLEDGRQYTTDDVKKMIEEFLSKEAE